MPKFKPTDAAGIRAYLKAHPIRLPNFAREARAAHERKPRQPFVTGAPNLKEAKPVTGPSFLTAHKEK